jgi:hypothetical protein
MTREAAMASFAKNWRREWLYQGVRQTPSYLSSQDFPRVSAGGD